MCLLCVVFCVFGLRFWAVCVRVGGWVGILRVAACLGCVCGSACGLRVGAACVCSACGLRVWAVGVRVCVPVNGRE